MQHFAHLQPLPSASSIQYPDLSLRVTRKLNGMAEREDAMAKRQVQSVYRIVDVVGESSTSWKTLVVARWKPLQDRSATFAWRKSSKWI